MIRMVRRKRQVVCQTRKENDYAKDWINNHVYYTAEKHYVQRWSWYGENVTELIQTSTSLRMFYPIPEKITFQAPRAEIIHEKWT